MGHPGTCRGCCCCLQLYEILWEKWLLLCERYYLGIGIHEGNVYCKLRKGQKQYKLQVLKHATEYFDTRSNLTVNSESWNPNSTSEDNSCDVWGSDISQEWKRASVCCPCRELAEFGCLSRQSWRSFYALTSLWSTAVLYLFSLIVFCWTLTIICL